ncbi:fimbrial biogenesis outer membrane usher protein [Pseudomonas sp. ITA]|uniref:fimbria/pilus outer membrane usher protein n=1 Tax=Pseudomonas sp. ITA TaxID=2825841 RepID=UPI0024974B61|nr:fimbria/pilus outer membrane usher protein [Pseudomonas sp. ITA]MDI2145859.1 fimbrial biogenesis outer membrane usher protein [Pseudomonas sp. ITA]
MNFSISTCVKRNRWIFGTTIWLALTPLAFCEPQVLVADLQFDKNMLWGSEKDRSEVDLTRFSRGNPVFPGVYTVQLYINNTFSRELNVSFVADARDSNATPCFSADKISAMGLNLEKLEAAQVAWITRAPGKALPECQAITSVVPSSSAHYDPSDQRLDVSIAQAYLLDRPKDYVDPALWDSGITAGRMNYALDVFQSSNSGRQETQGFAQLDTGFNAGSWRFRQLSTLNKGHKGQAYQRQRSYAQTDITSLLSTLTVGENYTDGQVFDSFGLRGALLATDDRMLPASQRGYAPIVRGMANTNARVTISQGGIVLYQRSVAPGPFEIKDLDPIGYGTDLIVTVSEADGSSKTFTVPYAASAQLLRPHQVRYYADIGQAWSPHQGEYTPKVGQFSGFYGLSNALTAYGGVTVSDDYRAVAIGNAISTPIGGISADITYAQNLLDNASASNGTSARLIYSTFINPTNTNITVSSYRYSTQGFWSFNDLVQTENARLGGNSNIYGSRFSFNDRQKSRFNINLNQNLGAGWGNIYISGETRDFWNRPGTDTLYQLTYSNVFKSINYNVSAERTINANGIRDNQMYVSFTMPLFPSDTGNRRYLSARTWHDSVGGSQTQASVSGVAGARQQYSYDISSTQSYGAANTASSYGITGGYQGSAANVTAGITAGQNFKQANLGVAGGVVVHDSGITFGQTLGETVALVEADNAAGAHITNSVGATVDNHGYGLVPVLSPYMRNSIELDPNGLSADVQLDSSSTETIPRAGAIVKANFATSKETSALIKATMVDGSPLSFGAPVMESKSGRTVGFVGQGGHIYVRGIPNQGVLWVSLNTTRKCAISYQLSQPTGSSNGLSSAAKATGVCKPLE